MPFLKINGNEVFYTINSLEQSRASIIFIHGSGGDSSNWYYQKDLVPAGITTVALDLPGHGQSQGPTCKSIDQIATVILGFISSLKLPEPLYLAGHSMGAIIVLYISYYYPETLDGIILIGGGARMKVLPSFLEGLSRGEFDPNFMRNAFGPDTDPVKVEQHIAKMAKLPTELLYDDFNICDQFDMRDKVATIAKPALIIVGEKDLLTPVKYSRSLHQELTASQLEIITNAGHFTMLEQPAQVNQAIAKFVLD